MSCNKCEVLPWEREPELVIFSVPHEVTGQTIRRVLTEAGIECEMCDLGVKVSARKHRWQQMLRALGPKLSEPEREGTKVALITGTNWQASLVSAQSLGARLRALEESWLIGILKASSTSTGLGGLKFELQAMADLDRGRLYGHEMHVKGVSADGRVYSPARMQAAAETLDLLFLLDQRCRIGKLNAAAALGLTAPEYGLVFINFRIDSVYNPTKCLQSTMVAVQRSGIPRDRIVFQAGIRGAERDPRHVISVLSFYRSQGFRLALRDVDSAERLAPLSRLELDYVRTIPELVHAARTDRSAGGVLGTIAKAAASMGANLVLPGIETRADMDRATALGVRYVQGHGIAKPGDRPVPPKLIADALAELRRQAA